MFFDTRITSCLAAAALALSTGSTAAAHTRSLLALTPATIAPLQVGTCGSVPPASCSIGSAIVMPQPTGSDCFGGCPTPTQFASWNTEPPFSNALRLKLPRYQPTPGYTETLVQVDVETTLRARGSIQVENTSLVNPCAVSLSLNVDVQMSMAGNPSFGTVNLSVADNQFGFLAVFDGTVDYMGPSSFTLTSGFPTPAQQVDCRRFTGVDTAFFVDTTPANTADDFFEMPHAAVNAASASGCSPMSMLADADASVEARVTYTVCRGLTAGNCSLIAPASCGPGSTTLNPTATACFGGCPLPTQSAGWNTEPPFSSAPRLVLPRYQPAPGLGDQLVQVDLGVTFRGRGAIRLENRDVLNTCFATAQVIVDLTASLVGNPSFGSVPLQLTHVQNVPLGAFDGVVDFAGASGSSLSYGTLNSQGCKRFTGPDTAFFVDTTPAITTDNSYEFSHATFATASTSGCAPFTVQYDTFASLEVTVTYTVCRPITQAPFCFGDGSFVDHTTACPCGNFGAAGHGCANSVSPTGAKLSASGTPANDDVVLLSEFEPASSFTLFMQHASTGDAVFHDGVLCAGNPLVRLRGRPASAGEARFPNSLFAQDSTVTLSQRGGVFPGQGVRRYYAAWYRNPTLTFCPPATANVSNGWRIDW